MSKDRVCAVLDKISEWSLYAIIFTLPFSKSIVETAIALAIACLAAKKIISRDKILSEVSAVEILLFIYLAASLPSFINTDYMQLSLRALVTKVLKFALLFLVTKETIDSRVKIANVMKIAALSCAIIIIDGFIQLFITHVDLLHSYPTFLYVSSTPNVLGNPTASFPFPNDYAAWILVFIFPTMMFALSNRIGRKIKLVSGTLFLGLAYSMLLARVRGAWAAFVVAFSIASIVKLKKLGVLLLLLCLLTSVLADRTVLGHIANFSSVKDRGAMWTGGWKIFTEHPVIGSGINTFFSKYAIVREDEYKNKRGSYAHNCYLQMAGDIGLIGLISFLAFVVALLLKGVRAAGRIKDPMYNALVSGITFGLLAFLLQSAVDTNLYSLNLAALFWFSSGFLMAVCKVASSDTQ